MMDPALEVYSPLFALIRSQKEHVKIAIDAALPSNSEKGTISSPSLPQEQPHCILTILSNVDAGHEECALLVCKRRKNDPSKIRMIDGMAIGSDFTATISKASSSSSKEKEAGANEEVLSHFVMTSRQKTIDGVTSDSQGIKDMLTIARDASETLKEHGDGHKHTWLQHYIDSTQASESSNDEDAKDIPIFSRFTTSAIAPAKPGLERPRPPSPSEEELRISIGTFNANGQLPNRIDLSQWLHITDDEPDILVVGVEEAEASSLSYMMGASLVEASWCKAIETSMGRKMGEYEKLTSKQLLGTMIILYIRKEVEPRLSDIAVGSISVGFGGWVPNKGAVAVRFELDEALSVCFVVSHLSAFDTVEALERRRWDYNEIVKRLRMTLYEAEEESENEAASLAADTSTESKKNSERHKWDAEAMLRAHLHREPVVLPDDRDASGTAEHSRHYKAKHFSIMEHGVVFWAGDLNFRLELGLNEVKKLIQKRQFESALLHFDQLRSEIKAKTCFQDFQEQHIDFAPTYKFDRNTDVFDTSEKQRIPSWTDRVLWKSKDDLVKPIHYESCPSIRISDHKPVLATFMLQIR